MIYTYISVSTRFNKQFNDSYPSSIFTQANKLENSLGVPVLRHSEKKPSGGEALVKHFDNVSGQQNIAMVGDRILTDVLFGNLNGNLTIWTSQIVTEKGDNKAALFVSIVIAVVDLFYLY